MNLNENTWSRTKWFNVTLHRVTGRAVGDGRGRRDCEFVESRERGGWNHFTPTQGNQQHQLNQYRPNLNICFSINNVIHSVSAAVIHSRTVPSNGWLAVCDLFCLYVFSRVLLDDDKLLIRFFSKYICTSKIFFCYCGGQKSAVDRKLKLGGM
jgi:hypothetical protein